MSRKRPTEASWDSDEDLLQEDFLGINAFPSSKDDEELDEDALLGSDNEENTNSNALIVNRENENKGGRIVSGIHSNLSQFESEIKSSIEDVEEYELLEVAADADLAGEDIIEIADPSELDGFEEALDTEQDEPKEEFNENEAEAEESVEEIVSDNGRRETYSDIQQSQGEMNAFQEQETTEHRDIEEGPQPFEESSESEDEEKGRGRFISERSNIISISTAKVKTRTDIPDTLEISEEQQAQIDEFMNEKTRIRNKRYQRPERWQQKGANQQDGWRGKQQHNQNHNNRDSSYSSGQLYMMQQQQQVGVGQHPTVSSNQYLAPNERFYPAEFQSSQQLHQQDFQTTLPFHQSSEGASQSQPQTRKILINPHFKGVRPDAVSSSSQSIVMRPQIPGSNMVGPQIPPPPQSPSSYPVSQNLSVQVTQPSYITPPPSVGGWTGHSQVQTNYCPPHSQQPLSATQYLPMSQQFQVPPPQQTLPPAAPVPYTQQPPPTQQPLPLPYAHAQQPVAPQMSTMPVVHPPQYSAPQRPTVAVGRPEQNVIQSSLSTPPPPLQFTPVGTVEAMFNHPPPPLLQQSSSHFVSAAVAPPVSQPMQQMPPPNSIPGTYPVQPQFQQPPPLPVSIVNHHAQHPGQGPTPSLHPSGVQQQQPPQIEHHIASQPSHIQQSHTRQYKLQQQYRLLHKKRIQTRMNRGSQLVSPMKRNRQGIIDQQNKNIKVVSTLPPQKRAAFPSLVTTPPQNKVAKVTPQVKSVQPQQAEEPMDEETKILKKKLEEQKRLRLEIIRKKEIRRQMLAEQKRKDLQKKKTEQQQQQQGFKSESSIVQQSVLISAGLQTQQKSVQLPGQLHKQAEPLQQQLTGKKQVQSSNQHLQPQKQVQEHKVQQPVQKLLQVQKQSEPQAQKQIATMSQKIASQLQKQITATPQKQIAATLQKQSQSQKQIFVQGSQHMRSPGLQKLQHQSPRQMHPPGPRLMHPQGLRQLHSQNARQMQPQGPRQMLPQGLRQMQPQGFRQMQPQGFRQMMMQGPRQMQPLNLQQMHQQGLRQMWTQGQTQGPRPMGPHLMQLRAQNARQMRPQGPRQMHPQVGGLMPPYGPRQLHPQNQIHSEAARMMQTLPVQQNAQEMMGVQDNQQMQLNSQRPAKRLILKKVVKPLTQKQQGPFQNKSSNGSVKLPSSGTDVGQQSLGKKVLVRKVNQPNQVMEQNSQRQVEILGALANNSSKPDKSATSNRQVRVHQQCPKNIGRSSRQVRPPIKQQQKPVLGVNRQVKVQNVNQTRQESAEQANRQVKVSGDSFSVNRRVVANMGSAAGRGLIIHEKVNTAGTRKVVHHVSGNNIIVATQEVALANENGGGEPTGRRIVLESEKQGGVLATPKSTIITIDNLSSSTSERTISELCTSVGPVEFVQLIKSQRKALVRFRNGEHAAEFAKNFQRRMVDLSYINITLLPSS